MKMLDFIDSYGTVGLAQIMPFGAFLNSNANVFFVDSGCGVDSSSGTYGESWELPFATLDYAIGKCSGVTEDVILLAPGHSESLTAAGAVTCDRARTTIIGLGTGSARPTFTFAATASTIAISAVNVTIKNIIVTPGIDEVVSMFNVTGTYCTLDAVDYVDDASYQTIQFLKTATDAAYLTIKNCTHYAATAASANQLWIALIGTAATLTRPRILDCTFIMPLMRNNAATCVISMDAYVVQAEVARCVIVIGGGSSILSAILCTNASTNYIHDCRVVGVGVTLVAGLINPGNTGYAAESYCGVVVAKSGILYPAVS